MTIDELRDALADPDDEVRYRALGAAGSLEGDPAYLDVLAACLGDESWRVRKAAIQRMVALGDRAAATARLVASLREEENAGTRNAAAEGLVIIGRDAVAPLVESLTDDDQDLRKFAADILGDIGDPGAVAALVGRISDDDENVRGAAAEALGKIGGSEAEAALVGMLQTGDLLVTLSALDALARSGTVVPIDVLRSLLSERLLRRPVFRLLARIDDSEALSGLAAGLADASRGTREAALAAFGDWRRRFDPDRTRAQGLLRGAKRDALVELCERSLDSDELAVKVGAIEVLAELGAVEVAPALARVAEDERVRDQVEAALVHLGAAVVGPLFAELKSQAPASQEVMLRVFAAVGAEEAIPAMVERLEHDSEGVRIAAAQALGILGDARAVQPLARLLGRPDRLLARAVVASLGQLASDGDNKEAVLEACRERLGGEDALRVADVCRVLAAVGSLAEIPLLHAVLSHEDPRAREAAVEALGRLGSEDAVDHLRMALADEAAQVRAAAASALGRQPHASAGRALLIALRDEDPTVVAAAAGALASSGEPSAGPVLVELVGDPEGAGSAGAAYAAIRALEQVGGPSLEEGLRRAAAHPEAEVVKEAARIATDVAGPVAVEVLLASARHDAWDVRRAAAQGLARRGDAAVLSELRAWFARETDPLVVEGLEEAIRTLEESTG